MNIQNVVIVSNAELEVNPNFIICFG